MPQALSAADYDEQWSRLGDFLRYNPGARHRRRQILALVRELPVTRVVDVGCGPGELLLAMARDRPGLELTGVDFAPDVIERNRAALPGVNFEVLDLATSHLDDRFDLVLCSEVIEHLDDWRSGVANLAAMVAPGKYLCISVPTGPIYATERSFGHLEHPGPDELRRVASVHGLRCLALRNWGFPTYRALKVVTNLRPELAVRRFGTDAYGRTQRWISNALYLATFLTRSDSPRGCQIFGLFQAE